MDPKILLLDEPAAGCNAVETEEIDHLIAELARDGIAILLVEHDMKLVMRISNHIVVLDHGEKIAEGDPATVSRNPAVIAAYLGHEDGGRACSRLRTCARATAGSRCCTASTSRSISGEIVTVVGANGAGKTTLLRCLSGTQPVSAGQITFRGEPFTTVPAYKRLRRGLAQSPEGRQIFTNLSVEENLRLGAFLYTDERVERTWTTPSPMFPILKEKRNLSAGGLSGGQQQMLAIARALMGRPSCLLARRAVDGAGADPGGADLRRG